MTLAVAPGSGGGAPSLEELSAAIIAQGSQSFAAASRLFAPRTRAGAHLLYAWCRHCDDMVDGQELGHGSAALTPAERRARVDDLEARTRSALSGEPQDEPVFAGLQRVAQAARLDPRWPLEHLAGFRMDVEPQPFPDQDALLIYCWRVAGVVGVMMAQVMEVDPADLDTLRRAQDLGLAFQLTNIARDVAEDARAGRVYLPAAWLSEAGIPAEPSAVLAPGAREAVAGVSRRLVDTAEPFYDSAAAGLAALPFRSAWAIAAARGVYREIGRRVVRSGSAALDARTVVPGAAKARLAVEGLALAAASRMRRGGRPRPDLWSAL